jgi:hypothetical protein
VRQLRNVWVECQVEALTSEEIVKALREGRYVSRIAYGAMSRDGKIKTFDYLKMISLRTGFLAWRTVLLSVPDWARTLLVDVSRPMVKMLKRRG